MALGVEANGDFAVHDMDDHVARVLGLMGAPSQGHTVGLVLEELDVLPRLRHRHHCRQTGAKLV